MMKHNTNGSHADLYSWLSLALTPKIGPVTMHKLLNHFGSCNAILDQDSYTLGKVINKTVASLIINKASEKMVDQALDWQNNSPDNHIIIPQNSEYPYHLKQLVDAPLILFAKGRKDLLKNNKFAIVGTRHPSEQGSINAYRFAENLANNNLTIVSGMASGIDRHAHKGAINTQASTIAVLGTGVDLIYPSSNRDLYSLIIENGLALSEFPLNTQPLANNFPRRNRIVAGLSLGCLVIESAIDGGSLITANLALDMGREVMAIPGSIHNPAARGCHKLIKNGAKLIETTNDILEELQLPYQPLHINNNLGESNPILKIMGFEAIEIDKICSKLNIDFADMCAKLLELELNGQIANCGNGKYQRIFK